MPKGSSKFILNHIFIPVFKLISGADLIWLHTFLYCRYETINIHLKDKPDWFLQKNPLGLVPTLETPAGEVIYESPITCEYLDEVYPEKKLLPSTPFGKAQQKMMLEHFSKVLEMWLEYQFAVLSVMLMNIILNVPAVHR